MPRSESWKALLKITGQPAGPFRALNRDELPPKDRYLDVTPHESGRTVPAKRRAW